MYILKLWNKEWGHNAKFIAYNPTTKKYTEYSPRRTQDIVWVSQDLTQSPHYKNWESCDNESIPDLEDAAI